MICKPLKYHGGKHYLAGRIVGTMPQHTHYVEPYFGSGAVFFRKPRTGSEIINDLAGDVVNFYRVLQDPVAFTALRQRIELTPFSEQLFELAADPDDDPISRAAALFVRNRQSRQGLGRDFATPSTRLRRGMPEHLSAWLTAIDNLPAAHVRLQGVEILNRDAVDVIRSQDSPDALFYLDPPYLAATRTTVGQYGCHEMTDDDHRRLLQLLQSVRGKVLLSGYPNPLYDEYLQGWRCERITIDNKASGCRNKRLMTECLWTNYKASTE